MEGQVTNLQSVQHKEQMAVLVDQIQIHFLAVVAEVVLVLLVKMLIQDQVVKQETEDVELLLR